MVCIFREAEDIHSRESSNTYINSLGSYFIDFNLLVDLSNTSIGSLDSSYSSDASMVRSFLAQNWCWSSKTFDNSHKQKKLPSFCFCRISLNQYLLDFWPMHMICMMLKPWELELSFYWKLWTTARLVSFPLSQFCSFDISINCFGLLTFFWRVFV